MGRRSAVLDCPYPYDPGNVPALVLGQFGAFFGHDAQGSVFRFIQQARKPNRFTGTSLKRSAILPQDGAEPNVGKPHVGAGLPARESGEELAKMELLAPVRDVNDFVGTPGFDTECEGSQVGGGVIESAIGFLNDERVGSPVAVLLT